MRELEDGFKFPGGKVSELTPLAQLAARQGQHIVYIVLITYFWTRFLARGNGFFAIPCAHRPSTQLTVSLVEKIVVVVVDLSLVHTF